jgi:hypothetical protein
MTEFPRQTVLVAEGDAIIGLATEAELLGLGYAVGGPFAIIADALAWLESRAPDCAVVGPHVQDGTSRVLCKALKERLIPIVLHSGSREEDNVFAEYDGALWIEKPATAGDVGAAVLASLHEP